MAVVGLEETFYEVPEGDMVEVCAIVSSPNVSCPIEFPFSVNLSTADGSAGMYYRPPNDTVFLFYVFQCLPWTMVICPLS